MITMVKATNSQGFTLDLPLDDVSDGLVIREIEGLDPVKATIVSSGFAQLDGTDYQSSRRDERNIILKLDLEPDYDTNTVKSLRKRLYDFFMPKSPTLLEFYDEDGLIVNIGGRVESCAAPLFTDEPQMDVSVICFDPDFRELTPKLVPGTTVSTTTEFEINYEGTVETGILFTLNLNRALTQFTIYHTAPDGTMRTMEFAGALANLDTLKISTIRGAKGATLTHSGVDSSILYGVLPQSSWLELQPGINKIRVFATGAAIPFTIAYTTKHGGL